MSRGHAGARESPAPPKNALAAMPRALHAEFLRFAAVGAIGFVVDAGLLTLLVSGFGVNVYAGRAGSFSVAVAVTWLMSRNWVFGKAGSLRPLPAGSEYLRYLLVQIVGALTNLGIFVAALAIAPELVRYPVIPLAAGAGAGLLVNFGGARRWVFAGTPAR